MASSTEGTRERHNGEMLNLMPAEQVILCPLTSPSCFVSRSSLRSFYQVHMDFSGFHCCNPEFSLRVWLIHHVPTCFAYCYHRDTTRRPGILHNSYAPQNKCRRAEC